MGSRKVLRGHRASIGVPGDIVGSLERYWDPGGHLGGVLKECFGV